MTEYVVLCNQPEYGWMEVRKVSARSSDSALRAVVADYSPPVEQWVAVPARSWKPVTVKVETKMALKFS